MDRPLSLKAPQGIAPARLAARSVVAATSLLLFLLVLTSATSSAAEPPSLLGSFGPDGNATSTFNAAGAIAVDQQTHDVYVYDCGDGTLYKFSAAGEAVDFGGSASYISGNAITGLSSSNLCPGLSQVAVASASHTVYVTSPTSLRAFHEDGEPAEFTAGPGAGTSEIPGFTNLCGVGADSNGDIYVSELGPGGSGAVRIFGPTGEPITQFSTSTPANIAIDSGGDIYVNRLASTVLKFTPNEFPVTSATAYEPALQPIDSNFSVALSVDPATDDLYIAEHVEQSQYQISQYDDTGALLSTFAGPGEEGELSVSLGVAVNADSGDVYASSTSQVEIFGTFVPPVLPPTIGSPAATNVTADSADLRALINPNTLETTYRFEYGLGDCSDFPDPCTSVPTGEVDIGSGSRSLSVLQHISGLQAGATYHYRVVAHNSLGATEGSDRTFTTQLSGLGFQLADSRAWEQVSPLNKFGGSIGAKPLATGITQAAADGEGLAYMTLGSIEAAPEGNRAIEDSSVLARRSAAGWHSKDVTPPHTRVSPFGAGFGDEYKLFSPDLSRAVLESRDGTLLSPRASERTPYLRENSEPAAYFPLLTSKEGYANVPPGTQFGGGALEARSGVRFAGANPDFGEIVLRSEEVPLVAGAAKRSLYGWRGGQLQAVSTLPVAEGGAVVEGLLGSGLASGRHSISDDGSRVFWSTGTYSDNGNGLDALYLHDTNTQQTTRLDVPEPGASGSGAVSPVFQGASADGTTVFFTDSQQLVEGASPGGRDLYRCEIPLGATGSGCATLADLSAPIAGSGESSEVKDLVPGISEDGGSAYFVAGGILDTVPNQAGASALSGQPNLYLWRIGEGPRFIATLSNRDEPDWGAQGNVGLVESLSSSVSPGGRYFAFMSERSLTGYENRDAVSGELDEEIFRYDASSDRLACISCDPSGASPAGVLDESSEGEPLAIDPRHIWQGRWVAAVLPGPTRLAVGEPSVYSPRFVLDSGRVFFNAIDSLVPADSNGNWDVYQYEPTGSGSCSASSGGAAESRSADGCVSLISSGTGGEAAFLDASTSGDDIFFLTPARLSILDGDSVNDIYDARVEGTPASLSPSAECLGEACQPAAVAPDDPTPASLSFKGPGNQRLTKPGKQRCPKGKHRVRSKGKSRCVASKHKKQHRHAGTKGRANR